MNEFFSALDSFVWSPFLHIPLLLGTGLWQTIRLGVVQLRMLGPALRLGLIDRKDDGGEGDITQYQALSTALAATVGVGNIVGVGTALGPRGARARRHPPRRRAEGPPDPPRTLNRRRAPTRTAPR